MRAAKAAKDLQAACGSLAERLGEALSGRVAEASDITYFSDQVLPLLVTLAGALCEERPQDPKAFVQSWAGRQSPCPREAAAPVSATEEDGGEGPPIAARPPEGKPSSPGRPKGRVALEMEGGGGAGAPAPVPVAALPPPAGAATEDADAVPATGTRCEGVLRSIKPRRESMVVLTQERVPQLSRDELRSALLTVPTLQKLGEQDMERVVGIARLKRWEQDELVVQYDQVEDGLHVVVQGTGRVSVPQVCGQVQNGDFLGENGLRMPGARSAAQVVAMAGGMVTVSVSRDDFEALELDIRKGIERKDNRIRIVRQGSMEEPTQGRASVYAVGDGRCQSCGHKLVREYEKTAHDKAMIRQAVAQNKVLGEVMSLTEEQCEMFVEAVHLVEVSASVDVFRKGQKGTAFFIIQEGFLKVHLQGGHGVQLRRGDSFGELALLYDEPRAATVQALVQCKLWVMPQLAFRAVSQVATKRRLAEFSAMLRAVPALVQSIDATLFDTLASMVEESVFQEGDELCTEGEDQGTLFVMYEGKCTVQDDSRRVLQRGDWIGAEEVSENKPATKTVLVTSDTATVLVLEQENYRMVLDATKNLRKQQAVEEDANSPKEVMDKLRGIAAAGSRVSAKAASSDSDPSLSRCEVVGALGEGSFGLVMLLRDKTTKQEFALKAMSKDHLRRENQEGMVKNERRLMTLFASDFIVRLHKSYEDSNFLFLMLDSVYGGELFDVFTDHGFWGQPGHARFYIANVILGLSHMHGKRVVWRDLKLENCLLDSQGYVKLTDLGIAKLVIGKTYTVCGTADYFAPETLRQLGHNRAADWWACGVLLFIMIAGRSPFDAPEVSQIYKNIIKGMAKVDFPRECPPECKEVILGLCRKKPEDRITMQKGGVSNLTSMPFFDGLDWEELARRRLRAPYVPPEPDYEKIASKKLSREVNISWSELREWCDDDCNVPVPPQEGLGDDWEADVLS